MVNHLLFLRLHDAGTYGPFQLTAADKTFLAIEEDNRGRHCRIGWIHFKIPRAEIILGTL